jgi:sarcosine oxidase subunit gamma
MAEAWTDVGARMVESGEVEVRILRLRRPSRELLTRLGGVLGMPPPTAPNTAAGREPRLLWLAPGEWAVVGRARPDLPQALAAACGGALHDLADLMAGWTAFRVIGEGAAELMAKGCSLDLHPAAFGADRCGRTLMAQVPVLIAREPEGFVIYVDRSFAGHMRAWFASALGRPASIS